MIYLQHCQTIWQEKHQYTGMTTCYLNKNDKNYGTERLIFHIVDKSANI